MEGLFLLIGSFFPSEAIAGVFDVSGELLVVGNSCLFSKTNGF